MLYNVFDTQAEAEAGQSCYWTNGVEPNMPPESRDGVPVSDSKVVTKRWATPRQRATDGKWVIPVPPVNWQGGCGPYTEEELDNGGEWFPEVE